jgi:mitosis inhibitor protein kinase SWE1
MSDDEDHLMSISDHLAVPAASTSANSLQSDEEDNLVTPGIVPDASSGWPRVFITGTDDVGGKDLQPGTREGVDVDAFIMRTLASASKGPEDGKKKVPGTPVKRAKTAYIAERPWQSAVAAKIDREDWDMRKGKVPRKSLPAAFPGLGQRAGKLTLDQGTDSEEEEESPSSRRDKYVGLGLGRPSASTPQDGLPLMSRTRWLMRRSSSGAFSSGSESQSSAGTPTRVKGKGSYPKRYTSFYRTHSYFDRLALATRARSIFAIEKYAQAIAQAFCWITKQPQSDKQADWYSFPESFADF